MTNQQMTFSGWQSFVQSQSLLKHVSFLVKHDIAILVWLISRHPGLLDMKQIQTSGLTIFATAETIYLSWQLKNSQAANTQNL